MRIFNSSPFKKPRIARPNSCSQGGFTLVEGLVAILLLAGVGLLITSAFSFSFASQNLARVELEAARSAGQILEILRSTSYDSLTDVENGNLNMDPLGRFQQMVLADISDRLYRNNLAVYLTIEPYQTRTETKLVELVIATIGVSPNTAPENVPPGDILVRQTTLVTKKGINP
ncbi:MAG: type II secretion system protein [Candidatus Omnitrophica bacterium]|nr:type II secretion system protein [Candidatus Omnitrophota bacterium]